MSGRHKKSRHRELLLVEDSRSIASILKASIESAGEITCHNVVSYAEADALLQKKRDFFVAVLDLNLADAPEGEIVDLVQGAGIPVIVLSGNMAPEKRQAMYDRGVADYVVKDGLIGIEYVTRLVNRMANNRDTKILVVDDSAAFRQFLDTLLRQHGYQTLSAVDGVEGLAMLHSHIDIRVVVTDYNMPRMDGLTMVAAMRKLRSQDELAIVGVSDSKNTDTLARFLKGGASDYLHKPFSIEEFYCRIDQNVDMLRVIRKARDAANRDFLTGLHNRRYFFDHAGHFYKRAAEGELRILVSMIDIDHFKQVNDRFGHQAGDEALIAVAESLSEVIGGKGLLARIGGEEFACLRVLSRRDQPEQCLDSLRACVERIELASEGEAMPLTVSVGATSELHGNFDQMLAAADAAVYEAKAAGRNRFVLST